MSATRRQFIRLLAGFGTASMHLWFQSAEALARPKTECSLPPFQGAQRLIPNEPKVVARLSATELAAPEHAARLAKLRAAVCRMKALPAEDVTGWSKQIAQHCVNCAPENAANIHYSGRFLPWHRAYLYFSERILRRLSGDDDLRLVYWDWESLESRAVPDIYKEAGQCLFHANRDYHGVDMKEVDVLPLLAVPAYQIFGGGAAGNPGAAYGGPHANVHNAFDGDMSDLQYSPRDPVFYAHHGNIDRLWSSWVLAGHGNPDFGADKVYFYDEDRKPRYILLNDLKDESKLGYQYSSYMKTHVRLKDLDRHLLVRQGAVYTAPRAVIDRIMGKESEASYLIIINIRNLGQLPRETHIYGIFAGPPNLGWINHMDANYLGKVADIRSGGVSQHHGPLTCALDVSERLAGSLRRQKGVLKLMIAPLDAAGKIVGAGVPLVADSVMVLK